MVPCRVLVGVVGIVMQIILGTQSTAPLSIMRLTHLLSSVGCCAVPIMAIVASWVPEMGTDGSATCGGCGSASWCICD